ncbi:DUF6082 family protein [Sphaerisporangium sp. NPDC005289]|uniref:DUF6082 family protein n=1 Tax=Sphaerisporangium sp. NPDC005289 TaxID=3155247 RepID=UPI00339DFC64
MVSEVRGRRLNILAISAGLVLGVTVVAAGVILPVLLLLRTQDAELHRWSEIGQAVTPVGVLFSGVAFIAIALTLLLQNRELRNQRDELAIAREEQMRSSEIALRELHTGLIRMAIDDPELRQVWPEMAPGLVVSKKDHYCNLILNLQKVAYETHTIELGELRGALRYLMASSDMYSFWAKARSARLAITGGDDAEDFFTAEVDGAFSAASPPRAHSPFRLLRSALLQRLARRPPRRAR